MQMLERDVKRCKRQQWPCRRRIDINSNECAWLRENQGAVILEHCAILYSNSSSSNSGTGFRLQGSFRPWLGTFRKPRWAVLVTVLRPACMRVCLMYILTHAHWVPGHSMGTFLTCHRSMVDLIVDQACRSFKRKLGQSFVLRFAA